MLKILDHHRESNYNVVTMRSKIIRIGNSKGVRIPKSVLEETKMSGDVEIKVKNGEIRISAAKTPKKLVFDEGVLLSRSALAKEWDTPEEDAAWAYLQ